MSFFSHLRRWKIVVWLLVTFGLIRVAGHVLGRVAETSAPAWMFLTFVAFGGVALMFFPWFRRTVSGLLAAPFMAILWPGGRFTAPPDDLLRKLRARVRDHQGRAVESQVRRLLEGYGPRVDLYVLLVDAVRTQGRPATEEMMAAERALTRPDWLMLCALVQREEVMTEVVALEETSIPGLMQPVVENPSVPPRLRAPLKIPRLPDDGGDGGAAG